MRELAVESVKLAQQFWKDGFVIVRSLFSSKEILEFRRAALDRTNRRADLLSSPELRNAILNPRVLSVFRELLGSDDLVYFSDSSTSIGPTDAGFHKDNVDKSDPNGPDWRGRYPIVRMGIYTEDHSRHPEGLDLRRGSHNIVSSKDGQHVQADTRLGDVVFWNLRTSHSGGAMKFLGRPVNPESVAGKVLRRLPMLRDKHTGERVALFATIGARGEHLDRFVSYLKTRCYAVEGWNASVYDEHALQAAEAAGIEIRNMRVEIANEPPRIVNRGHVPLPY